MPVTGFWQQLTTFKFSWDGYLLADSQAISPIIGWINNQQPAMSVQQADTPEGYQAILSEETAVFRNICSTLGSVDEISGPAPDWGSLIPLHLRTDMTFESMMFSWGKLNPPGSVTPCYILGNP